MKFRISELVVYEVEADSSLDAYEQVFNTTNGTVGHFFSIESRNIERLDPDTGVWLEIEEPKEWSA